MKKNMTIAALIGLVVVASTACGNKTTPTPSLGVGAEDSNDPYSAYLADDLLAINSATRELEYRCYAESGYPEYLEVLPSQKANAFRSAASTPDFETTFREISKSPWFSSEENARAAGYGHTIPGLDAQVFTMDGSFRKVFEDCRESTLRKTANNEETVYAYSQLGNTLAEAIATMPKQNKDALTKRVFECMGKGQYPVDPNGPNKALGWGVDFGVPLGAAPRMLEQPDLTEGPVTKVIPAEPAQQYVPTPKESESAAAMYQCSVETGAQADWQKAVNELKTAILAKHEATLIELNPKIKELAKSAALALQEKS